MNLKRNPKYIPKRLAPKEIRHLTIPETILILLGALLFLLLTFVAIVPAALHLDSFVVTSDSMAPVLERGDLIYVKPTEFSHLKPGDMVTFSLAGDPITHRIYSIDPATGELRTKADVGNRLDTTPVTEEMVIGRVFYRLPGFGQIKLFFEGMGG